MHLLVTPQSNKNNMFRLYETIIITIHVSELYRKGNLTDATMYSIYIVLKHEA